MRCISADESRHRFAAALQSAATLVDVEQAFLDVATEVIPACAHAFYQLAGDAGEVVAVQARADGKFLGDYEDYGRPDDPVLDFVLQHHRPIDSSRAAPTARWEQSGARTALHAAGYRHSLEAPVVVSGTLFGTVNFARTKDQPAFAPQDLVSARAVSEQLGLASERALRYELLGRHSSMLEEVLDRVPQALVVSDLGGRVMFRNRAARLALHAGASSTADAADHVGEVIAEAVTEFRSSGRRVHSRAVRDRTTGRQLVVRSTRLPDRHDAAITLVFETTAASVQRLPAWDVLSRREQEIAELVSQGLTNKQIAERAYISENTVKQHLKRVFAKTAVRNRAELMQRIWAANTSATLED